MQIAAACSRPAMAEKGRDRETPEFDSDDSGDVSPEISLQDECCQSFRRARSSRQAETDSFFAMPSSTRSFYGSRQAGNNATPPSGSSGRSRRSDITTPSRRNHETSYPVGRGAASDSSTGGNRSRDGGTVAGVSPASSSHLTPASSVSRTTTPVRAKHLRDQSSEFK